MRRRSRSNSLVFECLENRRMLAGNVNVLVNDAILLVVGDMADNQVEVAQDVSGRFVVTGIDTMINGGTESFIPSSPVNHVTISMDSGDDLARVVDVSVYSNFSFFGGQGNDRLETSGLFAHHIHAEGNQGDDVFVLDFATHKSAYVYLGAGNDVVSSSNLNVGRNLKIFGDQGNDTFSSDTLSVKRKLEFHLDSGDDSVLLSGATSVGLFTRINLGAGDDFAGVLPTRNGGSASFRNFISVDASAGNDNVAFDAGVNARGALRSNGGSGNNSIQLGGAQFRRVSGGGFQNFQVANLDNLIADVVSRLEDVGIGADQPFVALAATATSAPLNVSENASAISIDSAFAVTGSEPVTGAEIQINNFAAGQDVLTFSDSGTISGSFDLATGTMRLTGNATSASYQSAIRSVQYRNTSDVPLTDQREFGFAITTNAETVTTSRQFQVMAVNDLPVILPDNANQTVLPDDLPVVVDPLLTVTDADTTNLTSAIVNVVSGFVAGEDTLSSQDSSGITATYDATTGSLSLTGDASVSAWQTVLRTVAYSNDSANPTAGARTIRISVDDGLGSSSADFEIDLQAAQVNNFNISESAANGTVVGQVTTSGAFQTPTIYQFANSEIAPDLLLNADDHISGDLTASVELIEYIDFQCPACATYHPVLEQLETGFEGDLMVVTRHLPLESFHINARAAAIAAEAAGRQGMFDAMADQLLTNQAQWQFISDTTSLFENYAADIGLDLDQFRQDRVDPAVDARVTRDQTEANGLGIMRTPRFVLQGEVIDNPASEAEFDQVITDALGNLNDPFAIHRQTGEIILRDTSLLDSVNNPILNLSVQVSDAAGNTETVGITINVLN